MIKKIENDKDFTHRHIHDVKRIQQVLLDNNYSSLLKDCAELWENYSDFENSEESQAKLVSLINNRMFLWT